MARTDIVLNGRTVLPDRSRWTSLLSDTVSDASTVRRIRAVQELEARGATVTVLPLDLSHPDADGVLATVFAPGELRGVFHAAAAFDITPIERLGVNNLRSVLRPKTLGSMALSRLGSDHGGGLSRVLFLDDIASRLWRDVARVYRSKSVPRIPLPTIFGRKASLHSRSTGDPGQSLATYPRKSARIICGPVYTQCRPPMRWRLWAARSTRV